MMINQQQLLQMLDALRQKNNQPDGGAAVNIPQLPSNGISSQSATNKSLPSILGTIGGMGDTQNAQGGVDPSYLTQLNQGIMKQMGQGNGNQPFPWQQQPAGQQLGQNIAGAGSGIMKFLSSFLGL